MSDIVAFLRARLDEEEDRAKRAAFGWGAEWTEREEDEEWSTLVADGSPRVASSQDRDILIHAAIWDPARVLAEIAVKRALLDVLVEDDRIADASHEMRYFGRVEVAEDVALGFARIYATHPDFDATWRTS